MKKKLTIAIVVLLLGVTGYFGYGYTRFYQFSFEVKQAMEGLGRFPSRDQVTGFRQVVEARAQQFGVAPVKYEPAMVERSGLGLVNFWFFKADMGYRGLVFSHERRVESDFSREDYAAMEAAGVPVRRLETE